MNNKPTFQKYPNGSRVRIVDDLGPSMSHFTSAANATVVGTYASQFGGDNYDSYTLDIDNEGRSSWYYEHQLTPTDAPVDNSHPKPCALTEACKKLGIEEFRDRIWNSSSRGELFHTAFYITTAMQYPPEATWFRPLFLLCVNHAEKTWSRPESVFQHMPRMIMDLMELSQKLPDEPTTPT